MIMMMMMMRLQVEADLLKHLSSGGSVTKIVSLRIGDDVFQMKQLASRPFEKNIIPIKDLSSLVYAERALQDETCIGKLELQPSCWYTVGLYACCITLVSCQVQAVFSFVYFYLHAELYSP